MKLKDMIFAFTGELQIDEETRLNNPKFILHGCRCNLRNNEAHLSVLFSEGDGLFTHGREYAFIASENGVTAADLQGVIMSHPVLSQFTLQQ